MKGLTPALIGAIVPAVFFPALGGGFVYDDFENFEGNEGFRGFGPEQLRWMFTSHKGHYIPLTWLTHALDYTIWGLYPWGYHLTNVLLHAGNAALFYAVLRLLLAGRVRDERWGAFVGALLFALHPLRVESVAWATARRDVLSAFFVLGCVWAYLRGGRWRAWAPLLFAASLLSKTQSLALPLVLLVLDAWPLGRFGRRALLEKVPWLALTAAAVAVTYVTTRDIGALFTAQEYGWRDRLLQPGFRLLFYVGKTLWPTELGPLYFFEGSAGAIYPACLAAAPAVTAAAWALRRRAPWLAAAWFSYVFLIAPVAGLVQAGPHYAAERYTYVACLPWAALAAAAAGRFDPRGEPLAALVAVGAAAALAVLTWLQIPVWHDELSLWTRAVRMKENPFACRSLAVAYWSLGRRAEARACFDRALALRPDYTIARADRGLLRMDMGDWEGAWEDLTAAIAAKGRADAYYFRALLSVRRGDPPAALADLREALERAPRDWKFRRDAGALWDRLKGGSP
jgi:tetratricopeptide (TPR) repeat protein